MSDSSGSVEPSLQNTGHRVQDKKKKKKKRMMGLEPTTFCMASGPRG